jgi:hypothetical protein
MTEVIEQSPAPAATDLTTAVQRVLAGSSEPLTLSKIRSRLPSAYRSLDLKELAEVLQRQVAANVLYQYPKYRSPQDRFWDRGMAVHVACLIRAALEEGPLPWSALRRKLPAYAQGAAQAVLDEQIAQGLLHRHPRGGSRGAERLAVRPPDPKDYLREELPALFTRLSALGFTRPQLRAAALELLHEEEWDVAPPAPPAEAPAAPPLAGPHQPDVLQPAAAPSPLPLSPEGMGEGGPDPLTDNPRS